MQRNVESPVVNQLQIIKIQADPIFANRIEGNDKSKLRNKGWKTHNRKGQASHSIKINIP